MLISINSWLKFIPYDPTKVTNIYIQRIWRTDKISEITDAKNYNEGTATL